MVASVPADDHAAGAVAVGDHAGEHRAEAPHQVGDRHRRRERLAADAELLGHRRQVEPHHLAEAHGDADDQPGRQHDDPEGPGGARRRRDDFLHLARFLFGDCAQYNCNGMQIPGSALAKHAE